MKFRIKETNKTRKTELKLTSGLLMFFSISWRACDLGVSENGEGSKGRRAALEPGIYMSLILPQGLSFLIYTMEIELEFSQRFNENK